LSEIFIILRGIQLDIVINVRCSLLKEPVILLRFSTKFNFFSTDFRNNSQNSGFMKIISVGSQLSNADGRADVKEVIVAFRNFANEPEKKWSIIMITRDS